MVNRFASALRRAALPVVLCAAASAPLLASTPAHAWWSPVGIGVVVAPPVVIAPPVVVAPPVVYAPPPVVVAPPPVVAVPEAVVVAPHPYYRPWGPPHRHWRG